MGEETAGGKIPISSPRTPYLKRRKALRPLRILLALKGTKQLLALPRRSSALRPVGAAAHIGAHALRPQGHIPGPVKIG